MELFNTYPWLLAIIIFFARICDVSLGTVRTIIVFRGYRFLAAIIGFCEVSIWVMAAGKVLTNLNAWYLVIAYSAGYATGNIVGIWLENKLAIGNSIVRVFSKKIGNTIAKGLRESDFYVTEVSGSGYGNMPIDVIFIVSKRRNVPRLLKIVHDNDPEALYTIEDIRSLHEGIYSKKNVSQRRWWSLGKRN